MKRSTLVVFSLITLGGCMGSWAQDTHVAINPALHSTVHGDAEVAQSTECATPGNRCEPAGGSDILLVLDGVASSKTYAVLLARRPCSAAPNRGTVVASGRGRDLRDSGVRVHVDTPIHQLVKNGYSLVVMDRAKVAVAACGTISSDAPY